MQGLIIYGAFLLVTFFTPVVRAENVKMVVAEATYVMGDSDTLIGAEENVLFKAKRAAIEQTGIYLEAMSQDIETSAGGQSAHINSLGIRTLSAAVTETEVLEKRRTLEKDRLILFIKIRTTVHLDWLTEAIKRMKVDEQLASHHRQLQLENTQLKAELDRLRKSDSAVSGQRDPPAQGGRNRRAAEGLVKTAISARTLTDKIENSSRAIEQDNSFADAYIVRGQTYLRAAALAASGKNALSLEDQRYIDLAFQDFEHALTLDKTNRWALLGRGDAYTWLSRLDDAAQDYKRILKFDPLFDIAQQRLIALYTRVAKKQASARQWQQALTSLSQILSSTEAPSWVIYQREAYLLRSQIYTELGEIDQAIEDLGTVIRVDPTDGRALLRRGQLYRRLLKGRLAREDLERACVLALEEACASL